MVKNNYTSEGEKSEARQELPRETPAGENATLPAPIREFGMEAAIGAKLGLEGQGKGTRWRSWAACRDEGFFSLFFH